MRFRRKAKLFPGVYLNFSKSGISTTIGVPGASINIGNKGTYLNTGIPGTGLYNRVRIDDPKSKSHESEEINDNYDSQYNYQSNEEIGAIKSSEAESTTSSSMKDLKIMLIDCYKEKKDLKKEVLLSKIKVVLTFLLMAIGYLIIVAFFVKWFKEYWIFQKEYLKDLKKQYNQCYVNIDINFEDNFNELYNSVYQSFKELIKSRIIWDITSEVSVNQKVERSSASRRISRKPVIFNFSSLEIIKSKYDAIHFQNANGGDLYLYPAFIAIVDSKKKFGIVDLRDLDFYSYGQEFLEEQKVPKDATVVGTT